MFSPTALYVQPEVHSDETPNAVELRAADVEQIISRLSLPQREAAKAAALPEDFIQEVESADTEIGQTELPDAQVCRVEENLADAPPIPFDVARQVRVFAPYIQYVEIRLSGCAIQRHLVAIPKAIQGVGQASKIAERLRTTFDLLEKSSAVSSRELEDELRQIRKNFTRALGDPWGRVLLRAVRPKFEERIEDFRANLNEHKERASAHLEKQLNKSRDQVIDYYVALVRSSPPDTLLGQIITETPSDEQLKDWLDRELRQAFPTPEELLQDMKLDVQFRDVTYETLNQEGFKEALDKAYPHVDWKRPFDEFHAAGERDKREGAA